MVTLIKYGALSGDVKYNINQMWICGLSTDTPKPTTTIDGMPIPNGSVYTEVDTGKNFMFSYSNTTWYEVSIGGGGTSGGIVLVGETTTQLTDNATTNPITVDGQSYTAQPNDAVIYGSKEFLFDGTKWHEFGDLTGLSSKDIGAMTNYAKAQSASAIATSDTLNQAVGKLEYKVDLKQNEVLGSWTAGTATSHSTPAGTDTVLQALQKIDNNQRLDESNISSLETNILLTQSIVTGNNIFNKNTFIYNAERDVNTGEIKPNANYGVSELIPVVSGKTVYFSYNSIANSSYIAFIYIYGKDGLYNRKSNGGVASFIIPNDCGYISICILNNKVDKYQVEYDTVTSYAPFDYIYSNDLKNRINSFEILASVNMFGSIAGVGDSYTAGQSANSSGTTEIMTEQSYIATMGKRSGVTWHNYAFSGATSKTYITGTSGLPALLAANADDLYIINLGQNDINVGSTVGTIADINDDYTQNPDTYYGNMGSIIAQIKNHAPNAKIILVKSWLNTNKSGTEISYQSLDNAIAEIAAHFNIPCIAPFDDVFFNSANYQNYRVQGHPTTMGYAMMGVAMERLLSKCIVANPSYFQFSTIG